MLLIGHASLGLIYFYCFGRFITMKYGIDSVTIKDIKKTALEKGCSNKFIFYQMLFHFLNRSIGSILFNRGNAVFHGGIARIHFTVPDYLTVRGL